MQAVTHRSLRVLVVVVTLAWLLWTGVGGIPSRAQQAGHGDHGTPIGWKLTWPKGDPARGRDVFAKLECYSCHEVRRESFRAPSDQDKVGPELSQMGPLHDAEYFVDAIINPSATIEKGRGYEAPDGSSKMPSFNDSMSVQELIDLVTYLRALRPPAETPPAHGSAPSSSGGQPQR